ncbi:metallophosphoesterase [Deltaproteobacteria bacterium TL4]
MSAKLTFMKSLLSGAILLLFLWGCEEQEAELLHRKGWPILPYTQNVTSEGMTILWESNAKVTGVVEVFLQGNLVQIFEGDKEVFHKIILSGLDANTEYQYLAKEGKTKVGPLGTFRTAPPEGSGTPFSFLAIGDSGLGTKPQYQIADQMTRTLQNEVPPAFILHTGDIVYDGFERNYPAKFFDPYRSIIYRIPFYPVLGDHDLVLDATAYYKFFAPPPNGVTATTNFFSFTYGNALFVGLDYSQMYNASGMNQQMTFLENKLQAFTGTWKFVFLHKPMFTDAVERNGEALISERLNPLAEKYGVAVVFAGDVHLYERFHKNGVTYINTGGGGADLRALRRQKNSEAAASRYNFVQVLVDGNNLTLSAYGLNGELFDVVLLTQP